MHRQAIFRICAIERGDAEKEVLLEELLRIAPREVLLCRGIDPDLIALLRDTLSTTRLSEVPEESFACETAPLTPAGFKPKSDAAEQRAAAALLSYVHGNQPFALTDGVKLRVVEREASVVLDPATCSHLELFEKQRRSFQSSHTI